MQKYRPDIDGLRAIAVIPVVLFHAGIPGFSGGYVGVDVFFVISGYLITSILYGELENRKDITFSSYILRFYERRIRRILPALFAMMILSTFVACLILMPTELHEYGRSVVATILFGSNFLFWREAGYFNTASESKPLLHTWSLAVEEQFYIVFPIILLLGYRFAPKYLRSAIAVGTLGSLALSVFAQNRWPEANFFLPLPRAWELLLGSLLALYSLPAITSPTLRNGLASLGLVAICSSIFLYDHSTTFPGATALLPTLGTAAIIYAGMHHTSAIQRALGCRSLVFFGLISYSLYLWHWPVLVFSRMYALRDLTYVESACVVALSVALAIFSWKFIEAPFRNKSTLASKQKLFSVTFGSMTAIGFVGIVFVLSSGFPQRLPPEGKTILADAVEPAKRAEKYECATTRLIEAQPYGPCAIGNKNAPSTIAVWGDSHAMALTATFDSLLHDKGLAGVLISVPGCPPVVGIDRVSWVVSCRQMSDRVLEYLQSNNIRKVIVVGRWSYALHEDNTTFEGNTSYNDETRSQNIREGLHHTFQTFADNDIQFAFMMPVPGAKEDVPQTIARSILLDRAAHIEYSREDYQSELSSLNDILDSSPVLASAVISVTDFLCTDICKVTQDGRSLYFDSNHPSVYLNQLLTPVVEEQLGLFLNRQ